MLDQGEQVEREALDAVALAGFIGAAMTAHVDHDQAVVPGQYRHLHLPILAA